MNLKEFEGKYYFKKYGINVPRGFVLRRNEKIPESDFSDFIIKAQTLTGSRKKAGLIRTAKKQDLKFSLEMLFNRGNFDEILVEERINVKKEFYLSVLVDTSANETICLFSKRGGISIEDVDQRDLAKFPVKEIDKFDFENEGIAIIAKKMFKILKGIDAELVEINPLALTDKGFVALDSKIIVDGNSLFRQSELLKIKESRLKGVERVAFSKGIEYVELGGDVGVIGNGAGLVMSTLDILKMSGINPANFLDVGGGASSEKMKTALEVLMREIPKKVLINIFGGITRCDEIAQGIVDYKKENEISIPIFVRLTGSNSEEAKRILEENGIKYFETLDQTIKSMVGENV